MSGTNGPSFGAGDQGKVLVHDSAQLPEIREILVLKLDHLGDFVVGLPALRALRELFPTAHIRLVCGRWNRASAQDCGLVDEVRTFDLFTERTMDWEGRPVQDDGVFQAAIAGRFDLAVDFRIDDDTRYLLERVDAALRCGVGSRSKFPFLDIALPAQRYQRADIGDPESAVQYIPPDRFESRLQVRSPLLQESKCVFSRRHIVYGPYLRLPLGRLGVAFDLRVTRLIPSPLSYMIIDACRDDGQVMAAKRFSRFAMAQVDSGTAVLEFSNDDAEAVYEFRVFCGPRPLRGQIRFAGVRLWQVGVPTSARFRPAELHVGELLSLLVELIRQRTTDLYAAADRMPSIPATALPKAIAELPRHARRIVIAPFSNASIRDWPIASYGALIELLLARTDCYVIIDGSASQKAASERLVALCPDSPRLIELTGTTSWSDLHALLTGADLVICNNSGVAHLAARLGAPTLAIYAGTVQPQEMRPRGRRARAITADISCSPCFLAQLAECRYDHLCMRLITPEIVAAHAADLLGETAHKVASIHPASRDEDEARVQDQAGGDRAAAAGC